MKSLTKNIIVIGVLIFINLLLFIFCKLQTSPENYIWTKISVEKENIIIEACNNLMQIQYFIYANSINLLLLGIYFFVSRNVSNGIATVVLSISIYFGGKMLFQPTIAQNYYSIFSNQSVQESFVLEPIKAAGKEIGPLLLTDVNQKSSPLRKSAIIGLGVIKYENAADTLNTLMHNLKEKSTLRAEAYLSLIKINSRQSTSYARIFLGAYHPATDQEVIKYINNRRRL